MEGQGLSTHLKRACNRESTEPCNTPPFPELSTVSILQCTQTEQGDTPAPCSFRRNQG